MAFLVHCLDGPRGAELRPRVLQEHLDYIEGCWRQIKVAGPLLDEAGNKVGSAYVYDTQDPDEARRLLQQDPYHDAGVWDRVQMHAFDPVAGTWAGGLSWKQ